MKKLADIRKNADMIDDLIDYLETEYNKLRESDPSVEFADMQIITTIDITGTKILFFGTLLYHVGTDDIKPVKVAEKAKFIGMPPGTDEKDPSTWQELVTEKKVWDKDRFTY